MPCFREGSQGPFHCGLFTVSSSASVVWLSQRCHNNISTQPAGWVVVCQVRQGQMVLPLLQLQTAAAANPAKGQCCEKAAGQCLVLQLAVCSVIVKLMRDEQVEQLRVS